MILAGGVLAAAWLARPTRLPALRFSIITPAIRSWSAKNSAADAALRASPKGERQEGAAPNGPGSRAQPRRKIPRRTLSAATFDGGNSTGRSFGADTFERTRTNPRAATDADKARRAALPGAAPERLGTAAGPGARRLSLTRAPPLRTARPVHVSPRSAAPRARGDDAHEAAATAKDGKGKALAEGIPAPRRRASSLFDESFSVAARGRRDEPRSGARASRRPPFRPLLLAKLLGPRPLRPPAADLRPPARLTALAASLPKKDAAGKPLSNALAPLEAVEDLDPARFPSDRRSKSHWDENVWHDGSARAARSGGAWVALCRETNRWWAAAGEPRTELLRHEKVWWTRRDGLWFVVHEGEAWAWRGFRDWSAQGLFHPGTGTELVYSRDFSRVAVVTPGQGADVFDARTGALLAHIPQDRMPLRRRPKAPGSLTLP